jgi:hypothetical protein|tara:strand:- start:194 stop:379 length:186 start_codon:yes stop_codon:yes gene_type:complete
MAKTRKIDWDKIVDTHPIFRDVVAEEEGVEVGKKKKQKYINRSMELFSNLKKKGKHRKEHA